MTARVPKAVSSLHNGEAKVNWGDFLAQRAQHRTAALRAGEALSRGEAAPARALLQTWRFAAEPALCDRLLSRLQSAPPRVPPRRLAAVLASEDALPAPADPSQPGRPWLRLRWLDDRVDAPCPDDDAHRLAWALETLRFLGAETQRRQRTPWSRLIFPSHPQRDRQVAALWERWFADDPWSARADWEALFLTDAARAFAAVLRIRRIPPERRALILDDLREAFFFMMLGEAGATAGWRELAVRTLETTGPSPVEALCGLLDGRRWAAATRCAVQRGYGPISAALLCPDTDNPDLQARRLARRGLDDAHSLEAALDLHIACRQLDRWADAAETTAPDRSWQVVVQNRGRARARMRALLSGDSSRGLLQEPLLALPGLFQRTRFAIRRYCRDWAWIQLSQQFPFGVHPLDAPCDAPLSRPPLTTDDRQALQTWILLAILKDRLGHLRRWIQTGGTGDRDATWGRLLMAVPDHLRETGRRGAARGQHHLRAELTELLPEALERWLPTLRALGALPRQKGLGAAAEALLLPDWHPAIKPPSVRWRAYCDSAAAAARTLSEDAP